MNRFDSDETQEPRVWRHDRGAMLAGVCVGLAEDLDLPLPLIRLVAILFLLLPTGLAYLALGMLLRRRPRSARSGFAASGVTQRDAAPGQRAERPPMPAGQNWALLQHRFAALEQQLGRIETFVTSGDFELHRDFRRMGE